LSIKYDYHIKYYSGRINTYKLDRTTITVGVPRMLVMSTSPASAGVSSCTSAAAASSAAVAAGSVLLRSRGLALHLRQELFDSGGWATTTSGLPHRVPVAFFALLNGLGRRHVLQARKLRHQHELETFVLDYTTQDSLPLGMWSS
jgi:hypothetical protein